MWIFHPLHGDGYQFWSGIAGCIPFVAYPAMFLLYLRHHNCHRKGCWHLGHPHEGRVLCRRHRSQPKE